MPYASETANFILYTPFDSKSVADTEISEKLTGDEFLKHCYVKPQFQKNIVTEITDDNLESYDYVIKYDQLKDIRDRQEKDYINFLKWMEDNKNFKIYTISGNAGTGKTTFIHKLKFDNQDKNWIIFDMSQARNFVDWFEGIETNISDFNVPYNKMYAIVLECLCNILFNYTNNDIDIAANNLKKILNSYTRKFKNVHIRGNNYFIGLTQKTKKIGYQKNYEFLTKAANYTKDFFEESSINLKNNPKLLFRSALDILIIACCCVYEGKNHIIVFDNLERFISHDEIYNRDVDEIRRELSSYSSEIYAKSKYYNSFFKFILGMRTSSTRMCGVKLHSADELPSDLNLTNWFLIDDIISLKTDWYKLHSIESINIETMTQIICDIRTCNKHELTGLQLFINPLFNENIRLISDFIGTIVEKSSNKKLIDKYNQLWEENTPVSRFAARSIMRGLIYQELDSNDNLFHHLQLYTEVEEKEKDKNSDNYGLNYTRKILTILYNNSNEVTLEHIISELCGIKTGVQKYWNEEIPEKNKNSICEVLFYMNSYNRRDNDWIQFIDMQISTMENNIAADDIQTLKDLIDNNLNHISLRIMPAGEAYLRYIVQSFEYFSFRFHKNHVEQYKPLFSVIPTLEDFEKCSDVSQLACYIIINYVKKNALNCIENIIKNGDIKLDLAKNLTGKFHIQRIIDHHQGYIDKFIYYIRYKYSEDIKTNPKITSLIDECVNIKNEYNKYRNN